MLAGPLSLPETFAFDAAAPRRGEMARADLRDGFASWRLAWALARLDLRNRYRGSVIGPFWMTLSTLLMLVGLGLLYSRLLGLSLSEYLPHLTVSLVVWNVLAGMVTDACTTMTTAEGVIRQLRVPFTVHALRSVFRNGLTAAHSLPLIPIVFLAFGHLPGPEAVFALPGLGRYFVQGALNRDYPLVLGVVILYAALIILFNLIADLVYGRLDPRIRG